MNFGGPSSPCEEPEAASIVGEFLDRGNNFIDTANVYNRGQSEEIIGRAIRSRRDEVVIATKARAPQGTGPNDVGLSRLHLTRALEASLRRLGTDFVDLYQCHSWDAETPIDETMAALDDFVRTGKVRYVGCSNFTGSQIVEAQWAASRMRSTPLVSVQPRYSLVAREAEHDLLPAAERNGLGVLAYSPLGGGVLTGKYKQGVAPAPDTRYGRHINTGPGRSMALQGLSLRNFEVASVVNECANEIGATMTAVSLAWLCAQPTVSSIIIGPRTREQLGENLAGFDLLLPAELLQRLSAASQP